MSLYKQSQRCYTLLSKLFCLPSAKTLRCLLQIIKIHPGQMTFINEYLKEVAKSMQEKDKVCFLMWDEVSLQTHFDYNQSTDTIIGVEDFSIN